MVNLFQKDTGLTLFLWQAISWNWTLLRVTHLSNKELKSVRSCKDLGVYVSSDLSWSNHVDAIVNKANKVLGLLKRTVGNNNREIFSMLYKSLVRPILEYTCPVWSPYLVKDKLAIEKVPRRASRIALGQKLCEMSYQWRTLYIAKLEHTSAPERIPICSGMLQDIIWSKWPRFWRLFRVL